MRYDSERINNLDILEIASKLGLEVFDKIKSIRCVKHTPDIHPSMQLVKGRNRLKCFPCGANLSVIDLVMLVNQIEFQDACLWVYNQYNWSTPNNYKKILVPTNKVLTKQIIKKENAFKPNSEIYQWIIDNTTLSTDASNFLFEERKFSEEIVKKQNIRSIKNYNELREIALKKWSSSILELCGILSIGMGGAWYTESLLFPYYNSEGDIIQIQARGLNTVIKNKRFAFLKGIETSIYNIQLLKTLTPRDKLYIFEGVTDCLAALSLGLNAIAIPGAGAYKDEYVEILKDYNLCMIPDNDNAGNSLYKRIEDSFKSLCKCVYPITLKSEYKDFCEFYVDYKNGKIN